VHVGAADMMRVGKYVANGIMIKAVRLAIHGLAFLGLGLAPQ